MLTPERITALPTAEELEEGYYLLIDSPTLGTRKIAVENFIPPAKVNYIYDWDFTEGLTDKINGTVAVLNNGVTQDSGGLHFTSSSQFVKLNTEPLNMKNKTVVIEFGEVSLQTNNSVSILTYNDVYNGGASASSTGLLIFRESNGYTGRLANLANNNFGWFGEVWNGLSKNDISNKTIKLECAEKNKITLYVDGNSLGTIQTEFSYFDGGIYTKYLKLGTNSSYVYFYNAVVKRIAIYEELKDFNWNLTHSLIDSGNNAVITLSGAVQDQNGVLFDAGADFAEIPFRFDKKYIYEFDISNMSWQGDNDVHGRLIMGDINNGFIWRKQTQKWELYQGQWYSDDSGSSFVTDSNIFNGKTLKMLWDNNDKLCIYADDVLVYRCPFVNALLGLSTKETFMIGSSTAQSFYNLTITEIRIYENE